MFFNCNVGLKYAIECTTMLGLAYFMSCRFYYIAECSMNNAIPLFLVNQQFSISDLFQISLLKSFHFMGVAKLVLGYMGTNPLRNLGTLQ